MAHAGYTGNADQLRRGAPIACPEPWWNDRLPVARTMAAGNGIETSSQPLGASLHPSMATTSAGPSNDTTADGAGRLLSWEDRRILGIGDEAGSALA